MRVTFVRTVGKHDRVREALAKMHARWRWLGDRESIVVDYPE